MDLSHRTAIVTGGSRGLGLVEALVERGARVTVVARDRRHLDAVAHRLGVDTIVADVTDRDAACRIVAEGRPDILILNAGTPPAMARLVDHSWESFSNTWENDVKGGLYWMQAALTAPLAPGSRVLVTSSGAAVGGSPMSGGYGGAKRMLWTMANYANAASAEGGLGISFQTIVPRQMIGGTGTGDAGSSAYSRKLGLTVDDYLKRFGAPMPPRLFGDHVASILTDPAYEGERAFSLKGDDGITVLEGAAA